MDKVTLLPCPSCGWKDPSYQHIRDGCSLECRNRDCGLSVRAFNPNSHDKCGVNWNTRATPAPDSEKLREAGDYRLGLERAAHECEWMARGYAAYLMQPLLDAAKRIRDIPDNPDDEPHCKRRDGRKPAPGASL